MDRIHHASAIGAPPSVDAYATAGYPTEGNPGSGLEATVLTAWIVHSLIEEIRNVIVAAGITPAKGTLTQLLEALGALYGGGGSLTSNGWQKLPGGLIVQWGAVGGAARNISASVSVTFPIAFPNVCWAVIPTIEGGDGPGLLDMAPGIAGLSASGVDLYAGTTLTEGAEIRTFGWRWIAVGL